MPTTQEFQQQVGRIEKLVKKFDSADPSLRVAARDLVQSLMQLHGAGLERILEIVSSADGAGSALVKTLGHDELISSLLVLYGLHPEDFETRVRRGLEKVRPLLRSRGASIEVIAIAEDQVRLKLNGGPSDLQESVREALFETAPDAEQVSIDGAERSRSSNFVPLSSLQGCNGSANVGAAGSRQP